jgi:hypothetical protein
MNKKLKHIKSTGFKTPENYFNNLEEQILQSVKLQETLKASKHNGFKAPEHYFDALEDSIINSISKEKEKPKVIRLSTKQRILYALSVAAAIIIMIAIFAPYQLDFPDLNNETVENYIYQEVYSNEDLATLFSLDELNNITITDQEYTEESLKNYILENTSLEDLIIE